MDYDSARHHLEAVQNAKKKDEAKKRDVQIFGCHANSSLKRSKAGGRVATQKPFGAR